MHSRVLRLGVAVAACALLSGVAAAKQLRVNVTGIAFSNPSVTVNAGDHVVWIWTAGTHNVVSGDGTGHLPDDIFSSGLATSSATYSWKSTTVNTYPYYCDVHADFGMLATVQVVGSGATGLSDFRITEVQMNVAGSEDLIELTNAGAAGNLGKYRLKISGGANAVQTLQVGVSTDIAVAGGGHLVLHFATAGTNTATDLFFSTIDLPATGSAALYVPNTSATSLALASQIIDFVEWGAPTQENEAAAVTAGFWPAGVAVPTVAAGHSIEFCGDPGQYGPARWYDNPTPNLGSNDNCIVPTFSTTWGRIKTLYR
jgi:plastocyanin